VQLSSLVTFLACPKKGDPKKGTLRKFLARNLWIRRQKAFCNRAKMDKNVTGEDLAELKMALMDLEDDDCCGC
jgi:hypothetical protein